MSGKCSKGLKPIMDTKIKKVNSVGVAVFVLLFGFQTLGFQTLGFQTTVQAADVVLSYTQAVEKALAHDPRISEKEKLVGVARGLVQEAQGSADFIYDVNAFVALAPSIRGDFYDENGNYNRDSLDMNGVGPWYNLDFTAVKPLYTYGKIEEYSKAARENVKIKKGDVRLERANTYIDVTRAYYGYLTARDISLLLEDALSKLDGAIELVDEWLEDGKAKQSDKFALETGVAIAKRFMAEAKGAEKIAMAGLRYLTGVKNSDNLTLADKQLRPVESPETTLSQLQDLALRNRPEMSQVEAGLNARRALLEARNAEYYPNIYGGLAGGFAYSPDRARTDEIAVYDPFNKAGVTPVLGVKWDLSSGAQDGKVAQAKAELEATLELKSVALQGIPFQVAETYHTVIANDEMVKQLYKGARSGRRWMISSYADFEAGIEDADKVITALQAYVLAHSEYLRVVNDYNVNVAKLKVVTGEIQ